MIRLYVPSPRPILPIRDTDWVLPRHLSHLSAYSDQLSVAYPRSILFDVRTHARFAINMLKHRTGLPIPPAWAHKLSEFYSLPAADPEKEKADFVYAYERFPDNAGKPVIWMTAPTDIDKLRKRGWAEKVIQQEISFKREAARRAATILFVTHTQQAAFEAQFQSGAPTAVLRHFIPFKAASWQTVTTKWAHPHPVRLLFVGRAANRKGLPLVLDAYSQLRRTLGNGITLHVVTDESDGPVSFPSTGGLSREVRTNRSRTAELMRAAHFLLMPSREESYGVVYTEAMASGAIPLSTDMPNQRELLHDGKGGLLVERDAEVIAHSLLSCIEDQDRAEQLVRYGRHLWETEYQPSVVVDHLHRIAAHLAPGGAGHHAEAKRPPEAGSFVTRPATIAEQLQQPRLPHTELPHPTRFA